MNYFNEFSTKPPKFFGFLFWNFFFGYFPFGVLIATLSLFEKVAFTLNDKEVYGLIGFISYLIFIPLIALIFASVSWVYLSLGNYLMNMFNRYLK